MPLFRRSRKATDPERQDEDLLLTRPAPAWSHFLGAEIIKKGAILRWRTGYGTVETIQGIYARYPVLLALDGLDELADESLPKRVGRELSLGLGRLSQGVRDSGSNHVSTQLFEPS